MILTDKNIRSLCIDENNDCIPGALISPFSEESLQSESYDLAIGDRIAILNKEVCKSSNKYYRMRYKSYALESQYSHYNTCGIAVVCV